MEQALSVMNLTHAYPAAKRNSPAVVALAELCFSVEPGAFVALLGPNGSGKSTLFKILSTLLPVQSGTVKIFNADATTDAAAVRSEIGVVFQNPSLDKKLTVRENLSYHGPLFGIKGTALKKRVQTLLEQFSLSDRANDPVEHLSGGLKRRVEIAKGLLPTPRLLLLDEPSTGLDPKARRELGVLLGDLRKEGVTIILTTHILEEADRAHTVLILHKGRVVANGSPQKLKADLGDDIVTVEAPDPASLLSDIEKTLGLKGRIIDGTLRFEVRNAAAQIAAIAQKFSSRLTGLSMAQPSLEDVFIHATGERFKKSDGGLSS